MNSIAAAVPGPPAAPEHQPDAAAGPPPRSLRKRVWLATRVIRLVLMIAARVQIFVRVEKVGIENVPRRGRVILAGNHPSHAAEAAAFGEHVLAHDGLVVIFPSGRLTKPGESYRAKTGVARMAFATGSPIVPFYLSGTERILAKGRPRLMRRVRIVFGEPIAVPHMESPDRAELVALTRRVVDASDRLAGPPDPARPTRPA